MRRTLPALAALFNVHVQMKPAIALLALFLVSCGGGDSSSGPTAPTAPTTPAGPTAPTGPVAPVQVDGGQLFTYGNAVALLPPGIGQYKVAIVSAWPERPCHRSRFGLTRAGEWYVERWLQYLVFSGRESA